MLTKLGKIDMKLTN